MRLRRAVALVLPLAFAACTEVDQKETAATLVIATFASPNIPQPNDLALQAAPTLTAPEQQAQKQLLDAFIAAGGFPSDQEVPVTVPFQQLTWSPTAGAAGAYVAGPAVIDLATVRVAPAANPTVAVLKVDVTPPVAVDCDAIFANSALTLRKKPDATGSRRWAPGRYVVAVRGGASGVKATSGVAVQADQAILIASQNKSLAVRENWPLGVTAASAAQLEAVRQILWSPLQWSNQGGRWAPSPSAAITPAFLAAKAAFSLSDAAVQTDVASLAAFGVAPAQAVVLVDSGSGVAPLPFDLLRTGPNGTIAFNAAFGPAAQGLTTLDGFSTTAMLLAQPSLPVDASTVHGGNVHLFRLAKDASGAVTGVTLVRELKRELVAGAGGQPTQAGYIAQPTPIVVPQGGALPAPLPACPIAGGCSLAIGLQPAVGAPIPGVGTFYLPPLAENTSYAVVVTKRVRDFQNNPLGKTTVAKILTDITAPVSAGGVSLLSGVDATTAGALQRMKAELAAVLQNLPAGTVAADVAAAWTFKTQTVTAGALALRNAAVPVANPAAAAFFTAAEIGAAYGVDPAVAFPGTSIREFAEVTFPTVNFLLSGLSGGAFDPANPTPEPIVALVAIPDPALVTGTCPAAFAPVTRCAPLVVFRHGVGRSRADMLPIASALTARGFVVAAIDGEKHGDRTYCTADNQCLPPAACVADPKLKTPTDAGIVGRCAGGAFLRKRLDCVLPSAQCAQNGLLAPKGIPLASGNLVLNSLNFFRTRDTLRQDVIDQAALPAALAPVAPRGTDAFAARLAAYPTPIAVNPDQVYLASLSLGADNTALSLAVNPRFKRAAFQAGFATIVDTVTNPASSDFAGVAALFTSAGAAPGTAAFLQFVQLAKWILDPADPANYLPLVRAAGTPVLSQIGLCDPRIPNDQSKYFTALLGLAVPAPDAGGTGFTQWFVNSASGAPACDTGTKVDHGFLVDPTLTPTLTAQAQQSFADFLATGAAQPITVRP